jgi:hypothetical protein
LPAHNNKKARYFINELGTLSIDCNSFVYFVSYQLGTEKKKHAMRVTVVELRLLGKERKI